MSDNSYWADRRQFGRRPLNAGGIAELPGPVEIPCVIENISAGGALLSFPTGVAPIHRFDLVVEDAGFRLPCEMRHQVGSRFGVSFMRQDMGEALLRHFFPVSPRVLTDGSHELKLDRRLDLSSPSVRELRQALLPHLRSEASDRTDVAASAASNARARPTSAEVPNDHSGGKAVPHGETTTTTAASASRPSRLRTNRR